MAAAASPTRSASSRQPPASMLPAGDEKRRAVRQMFDTISGRYDILNRVNSLGMDSGWRRRCVSALDLPAGSLVLDVACGTGDLCDELARQGYRPLGLDLSPGMLSRARARARARAEGRAETGAGDSSTGGRGGPLPTDKRRQGAGQLAMAAQAPFVLADALEAPFRPASFDGAASAFALRNVVDLGALFNELGRVVRPGGRVSLLELGRPEAPLLRFGHGLWCNYGVPLVGSLFSDAKAYRYLPKSLAYLPPPDEVIGLLEGAGFKAVERILLAGGTNQVYVATRGGQPLHAGGGGADGGEEEPRGL